MKRGSAIVIALAVVGLAWFILPHLYWHKMVLRAYFSDARNIRSGADVRVAGLRVGTVKAVRIQPSVKDTPVEVTMALETKYDLRIPQDSVVVLQTAGVLGETYAEIEIAGTSGPPVSTNAVLQSGQGHQLSFSQMIELLGAAFRKCSDQQSIKGNTAPAENHAGSTNSRSVPSR